MIWLWVYVAITGALLVGLMVAHGYDPLENFGDSVGVVFFWPLVLPIAIVAGLCQLPILFGRRLRAREDAAKKKRKRLLAQQRETELEIRRLDEQMAREIAEKGPELAEWDRKLEEKRLRL